MQRELLGTVGEVAQEKQQSFVTPSPWSWTLDSSIQSTGKLSQVFQVSNNLSVNFPVPDNSVRQVKD